MYPSDQTITETISHCPGCGAGVSVSARFCRYCGVAQIISEADCLTESLRLNAPRPFCYELFQNEKPSVVKKSTSPGENRNNFSVKGYTTTPLPAQKRYHPVSGPLVRAVIDGVPATPSHSSLGSVSKRLLLALMAIPIWVMIILLSPLDAYASAKVIG